MICLKRMTMSNKTPWENIKTPKSDLSVRQVRASGDIPLYWGKDSFGQSVFIVELEGDHVDIFKKNIVEVKGLKIDFSVTGAKKNQGLIITLERQVDEDLFFQLFKTLIKAVSGITDSATGLSVALAQIKRWKKFLAGAGSKVLSSEEVRGLFAELLFLKAMLEKGYPELFSCEAWQGPESAHQDFVFDNVAVEVKSLSGRERNSLAISSEDQLESLNDRLFLKVYRLTDVSQSDQAVSLNQLVTEIDDSLKDPIAVTVFSEKIAKAGYIPIDLYDLPGFLTSSEMTFDLTDDFPRLVRSKLPAGITKVRYEIKLENIASFECRHSQIWGE